MNVRLAAQTLSSSVSSALIFCEQLNLLEDVKGTSEFCKVFNDAFDLCNSRNKYSKGEFSHAVANETLTHTNNFLNNFKEYVDLKVARMIQKVK